MARAIPLLFLLFGVVFVCAQVNYNDISLEKSTSLFAAKLIKELSVKQSDDNILISPVSIQIILGLLKLGAAGITAQELSQVLVLPQNPEILKNHLLKLQQTFLRHETAPSKEPNISIANAIYVRPDVRVSESFHQAATNYLNVDVRRLDNPFNTNQTIVEQINEWISGKTHGQINKVLEESDVTADTVMLLINTLHFKGKWRDNGFNESLTKMEHFYSDSTRFIDVPMMYTSDYFLIGFYHALKITYLELPYAGKKSEEAGDYVFAIYLPDTRENGTKLLNDNIEYLLTNEPDIMNEDQVDVYIPRFKIRSNNRLKPILTDMGLKHAFENAELEELTVEKLSVQVTDVIHNTALDVSEEGTEASAVTVVGVDDRISSQPLQFLANRPFMFVLKQKSTNIILFVGHYKNAKK